MNGRVVIVIIVVLGAVAVAAGIYFLTKKTNVDISPVAPTSPEAAAVTGAQNNSAFIKRKTCVSSGSADDVYTKNSATITDEDGSSYTIYDECTGSKLQVQKTWCYESPQGSGNYVNGNMVYDCPLGCNDGACTQTINGDFFQPYPVVWREDDISFSLSEVEFASGTVKLKLKIVSGAAGSRNSCVPLNLRRVVSERGDLALPKTQQFYFTGSGGCVAPPNVTFLDQGIVFEVLGGEKEFIFMTGGTANIFFSVSLEGGVIQAQNFSVAGEG